MPGALYLDGLENRVSAIHPWNKGLSLEIVGAYVSK